MEMHGIFGPYDGLNATWRPRKRRLRGQKTKISELKMSAISEDAKTSLTDFCSLLTGLRTDRKRYTRKIWDDFSFSAFEFLLQNQE